MPRVYLFLENNFFLGLKSIYILKEFIWKKIPPIQHDFTVICLITINTMISIIFTFVSVMAGRNEELLRLQGLSLFQSMPSPAYQPR